MGTSDTRFPAPGQDTRFPSAGTDARFATPGQDARFPAPGQDTRFDGGTLPPPGVPDDPISLFAVGGGTGTGVLFDTRQGLIFSDAGVTPAAVGDPVYRIVDRVAGQVFDQLTQAARGTLQADGIVTDGVDDYIPSPTIVSVTGATAGLGTLLVVTTLDPVQSAVTAPNIFAARTNNSNRMLLLSSLGTGRGAAILGNDGDDIDEDPASPVLRGKTSVVALTFRPNADPHGAALFVDGVEYGSAMKNGGIGAAAPAFHGQSTIGGFLKGVFRGAIIIDRLLTPEEMLQCKRYWQ